MPSSVAGCTYKIEYDVDGTYFNSTYPVTIPYPDLYTSSSSVSISVAGPTASLTINDATSVAAAAGTPVTFVWNSTGADTFSSSIVTSPQSPNKACGQIINTWIASTTNSTLTEIFPLSQAGCVFDLSFTAAKKGAGSAMAKAELAIPANSFKDQTCGILSPNQSLIPGLSLFSCNKQYQLLFQANDGNIVLYNTSTKKSLWATNTVGMGGINFLLQATDGNLVLYTKLGQSVYASNTNASGRQTFLQVGNDGSLALLDLQKGIVKNLYLPSSAAPTVSLSANGISNSLIVNPGDNVKFVWSSSYADKFGSTISSFAPITSNNCSQNSYVINSANGSYTQAITNNLASCIFKISYNATNSISGLSASTSLILKINSSTPTAGLTIKDGAASATIVNPGDYFSHDGSFTVNPGDSINFVWSSTNSNKFTSTITSLSGNHCGTSISWVANSANGNYPYVIPNAQAGCIFKISYIASNSVSGFSSPLSLILKVNVLPANMIPAVTFNANGEYNNITVQPGDVVNFGWSAANSKLFASSISTETTNGNRSCPSLTSGFAHSAAGNYLYKVPQNSTGCIIDFTYNAASTSITAIASHTIRMTASSTLLTSSLSTSVTANGQSLISINPGDPVTLLFKGNSTPNEQCIVLFTSLNNDGVDENAQYVQHPNGCTSGYSMFYVPKDLAGNIFVIQFNSRDPISGLDHTSTLSFNVNGLPLNSNSDRTLFVNSLNKFVQAYVSNFRSISAGN